MYRKTSLILLVSLFVLSFAAYAPAAHHEQSDSHQSCSGIQGHDKMPYCLKMFSEDEKKQVFEKSKVFLEKTKALREDVHSKKEALVSELSKKAPDEKTALNLQKQISELKAKLNQERIKHFLEIKKIKPDTRFKFPGQCICKEETIKTSTCTMTKPVKKETGHACPFSKTK